MTYVQAPIFSLDKEDSGVEPDRLSATVTRRFRDSLSTETVLVRALLTRRVKPPVRLNLEVQRVGTALVIGRAPVAVSQCDTRNRALDWSPGKHPVESARA